MTFNYDDVTQFMSAEEKENFNRVCRNLDRNPWSARPLWRIGSPRWIIHKFRWLMREIKLWWSEGEDVI